MRLERSHFAQPAKVALGLAEFRRQKRLDDFPRDRWPDRPATQADHVHVVVLDALARRKVVANQAGANSWNLVGTARRAASAPAARSAAPPFPRRYRSSER